MFDLVKDMTGSFKKNTESECESLFIKKISAKDKPVLPGEGDKSMCIFSRLLRAEQRCNGVVVVVCRMDPTGL